MTVRFVLSLLAIGAAALAIAGLAEARITEPVEGAIVWGDVRIVEDRGGSSVCGTGSGYRTDTRIEVLRNGSVVASWEKGAAGPLSALWRTEEHENGAYVIRSLKIEAVFGWPCYQWSYAWREIARVNVVVENRPRETMLSLAPTTSTYWLEAATLSATLVEPESGRLLAGRNVTFQVGSATRVVATGADGVARATVPVTDLPGKVPVRASFAGSRFLGDAEAAGNLTVLPRATRVALTAPASGYWREPALVYARLVDVRAGTFLVGETMKFSLGAATAGARVGSDGYAGTYLEARETGPALQASSQFAGRLGYSPSSAAAPFTVLPRPTAVAYEGVEEVVRGREGALRAVVTDALVGSRFYGAAIAGATVRFTLEAVDVEAETAADGRAFASPIVLSSYGPHAALATFAGLPGRAAAATSFPLDVQWEFVLFDEEDAGEVRLNSVTGEVQVAAFGRAFEIHAFAESDTVWTDSTLSASPPLDGVSGRRATLSLARDEFALEGAFDLATGRFVALARVGEAAFALRATGDVGPPDVPAPPELPAPALPLAPPPPPPLPRIPA